MGQNAEACETGTRRQYGPLTRDSDRVADVLISPPPELPKNASNHLQLNANSKPTPTRSNLSHRSGKLHGPREERLEEGETGDELEDNTANDQDFDLSPPAPTASPAPPPRTPGTDLRTQQGVLQPHAGDFLSTPTVSAKTQTSAGDFLSTPTVSAENQTSAIDASPSLKPASVMPRLTRRQARAMGVIVRPELAKNWEDLQRPFFLK